jgi:hypothetical protein
MGQLLFKKCFFAAIRGGTKRTTIRRWASARLKVGQSAYTPGLGRLLIESVEVVHLDDLTDADAQADGFASTTEMRAALRSLYPHTHDDGRKWFRIAFRAEAIKAPDAPDDRTLFD